MNTPHWSRGRMLLGGGPVLWGLLAGLVAFTPTPAHAGECAAWKPGWVFCEDFDDGTWLDTWDASPYCCDTNKDGTISVAEMDGVTTGGYNSTYTAWTGIMNALSDFSPPSPWAYDGHYGNRGFGQGLNEFYVRYYAYLSPNWQWGDTALKSSRFTAYRGDTRVIDSIFDLDMWGTRQPAIQNYGSGSNCTQQNYNQNLGNDITLQPGQWYLVELYMKMNTPGQNDGVTKLWLDPAGSGTQTLRWHHTNICWRYGGVTELPDAVFLSGYTQTFTTGALQQYQKWDQLVVSRAPIGPMGSTPPCPLRGDLDCSGKVDLDDLRRMIYMLIGTVPKDLLTADLDGDGALLLADLQALVRILVGLP